MVNYKAVYWILVAIIAIFQSHRSYLIYSNVEGIGGGLGAFIGAMIILVPTTALYFGYIFASRNKHEKRNQ